MKTPFDICYEKLCAIKPASRLQPGEDFAAWQERARTKLEGLLGLPLERCEPNLRIEYEREHDEYTEIRFLFDSEPGYTVPCHMMIPRGAQGKLTTFIALQGHSTGMHISMERGKFPDDAHFFDEDCGYALQAVRNGYCAIALEMRNFGECGGNPETGSPDCYLPSMVGLLTGLTTVGARVWDIQRLIDVLCKEPRFGMVDAGRLGIIGLSGGGTATIYAACLEQRLRYIVAAGSLCTFRHSIGAMLHCSCNYVPRIAKEFDMGDLCGMIAPRDMLVVTGANDPIFPLEGVRESYALANEYYKAAGYPDNCKLYVGDGEHRFFKDGAWPLINAMCGKSE